MTTRAVIENREAFLSTEFGEKLARRYFRPEVIESMGRYVRGQRKGLLKGKICWKKCARGGWVSEGPGGLNGYVENRVGKIIRLTLETAPWGAQGEVVDCWHIDIEGGRG